MRSIGHIPQLKSKRRGNPVFDSVAISHPSKFKLSIVYPVNPEELTHVIVNGIAFYKKGVVKEIVRVAPLLYPDSHFKEVNRLVANKHYSKEAALKDISDKYGYDFSNFRRAYYARKGSKLGVEEVQ